MTDTAILTSGDVAIFGHQFPWRFCTRPQNSMRMSRQTEKFRIWWCHTRLY